MRHILLHLEDDVFEELENMKNNYGFKSWKDFFTSRRLMIDRKKMELLKDE